MIVCWKKGIVGNLEVQNMDKIDILNRELFVDQLLQLVESISESKASVSFAIDGVWGCGKSFVLDMFEEQLEKIQSEKLPLTNT